MYCSVWTLILKNVQRCLLIVVYCISAPKSKNVVCANIKHSRYLPLNITFNPLPCYKFVSHIHLIKQILPFRCKNIDLQLISSGIFQGKRKYSMCDLRCRYCILTLWGRYDCNLLTIYTLSLFVHTIWNLFIDN